MHDVSPATETGVRFLLEALDRMELRPRSLLVVPREAGRPITRSPALLGLLRREAEQGSELVVHGYDHRRAGRLRGSPVDRARALLFAGQASEFLALGPPEARRRAEAGRRLLADVGLYSDAFCAPAWLGTAELPAELAQAGYRLLVRMASLVDLQRGRRTRLAWAGYVGAGPAHESLTGVGSGLVRWLLPRREALHVFLHPQGAQGSLACSRTLRLLERLVTHSRIVRYADLLA